MFSWGCNTSGQLGHMESPTTFPHLTKVYAHMHIKQKTYHKLFLKWFKRFGNAIKNNKLIFLIVIIIILIYIIIIIIIYILRVIDE